MPDLAHVARQLRALLAEGFADDVLALCEYLWELAPGPLNECQDEGETADSIGECLAVAIEALPKSGLQPAEHICWEMDHRLEDVHGVMTSVPALAKFAKYSRADWREVADLLRARLAAMPSSADQDYIASYRRTGLLNHAVDALKKARLAGLVIPLLESEADRSRCYVQLVDALIEAGHTTKYPDVALAIWRRRVEELIAEVKPNAYRQAVPLLERMRKLYTRTSREDEWRDWLAGLRREHRAKRRLIELLGSL